MLHAPMQIRRVAPTAVRPASDTDSFCPLPAADITKPHPAPGLNLGSTWAQPGLNLGSTWAQPGLNLGTIPRQHHQYPQGPRPQDSESGSGSNERGPELAPSSRSRAQRSRHLGSRQPGRGMGVKCRPPSLWLFSPSASPGAFLQGGAMQPWSVLTGIGVAPCSRFITHTGYGMSALVRAPMP